MSSETLQPRDFPRLSELGIERTEVERQLTLFRSPRVTIELVRPCTPGDGVRIFTSSEVDTARQVYDQARNAGRISRFVPASGAASRMFGGLARALTEGWHSRGELHAQMQAHMQTHTDDSGARETLTFFDSLDRFAFFQDLTAAMRQMGLDPEALRREGRVGQFIECLLSDKGLDYAKLPKGLLKFHRYPSGSRTAFEEHLIEAAGLLPDANRRCRLHFTIPEQHRARFEATLAAIRARCEAEYNVRLDVSFSHQHRSTDTIAVDEDNRPFRTADGALLFRPGGHGALLENLGRLQADLVLLKNIDNIVPDHLKPVPRYWDEILVGHLEMLRAKLAHHLRCLQGAPEPKVVEAAERFAAEQFGSAPAGSAPANLDERRRRIIDQLDRPLRVCAMVRNAGEPGGGPFWVRRKGRVSAQIVESAEVDPDSGDQQQIARRATHFNPVDMACALRDWRGSPYALDRYVDQEAVFIATKFQDGRKLKALERPGLWNGSMAYWNTVFVEVPSATFNPVKTVLDLLRPAHQPPQG